MKRIFALLLILALVLVPMVACTKPETEPAATEESKPVTEPAETTEGEPEPERAEEIVKLGLGVRSSIARSRGASEGKGAMAQADTTIAAVGFDAEGIIRAVSIDVAQTQVAFNEDGSLADGAEAEIRSKKELKDDYAMKGASGIGKEWYEQMEALENWMIGKTVDEVMALPTVERDAGHKHVPDDPDLNSSVTITVEDYQQAVKEAWDQAQDAPGTLKVGLGVVTGTNSSKPAADDKGAFAQINTTAAAVALDGEGKIVKSIVDVVQDKVQYTPEGELPENVNDEVQTKLDIGAEYGMAKVSQIGKEWFEQIAAFTEWMVGKTIEEVNGLPVKERDAGHKHVPDDPDLTSSVTITVEDYQQAVTKAAQAAK